MHGARHLSNLIYASGLAEHEIAIGAIPNLNKCNGHDLSNMLWAYANVEAQNSELFLKPEMSLLLAMPWRIVGHRHLGSFLGICNFG